MNDDSAIRQLITTWMSATRAGDTEAVLGLMTDDVLFLVAGQEPFGREAFARASREQAEASVVFDGESEIQEIMILGDWAYVRTRLTVSATHPGSEHPIFRSGHTLSILRKDAGRWLIARDANLLVAAGASSGNS